MKIDAPTFRDQDPEGFFLATWDDADRPSIMRSYKNMPEVFYSYSGLPVITLEIAPIFAHAIKAANLTLDFQEFMSGSSTLTWGCYAAGLTVGFPVDFRYGWNLRDRSHRALLDNLTSWINWYSPRCSPWSSLSSWQPEVTRETARQLDQPMLTWTSSRILSGTLSKTASIVENPQRSAIVDKTDLLKVASHVDCKRRIVDQCQYDAEDENDVPASKSTLLLLRDLSPAVFWTMHGTFETSVSC